MTTKAEWTLQTTNQTIIHIDCAPAIFSPEGERMTLEEVVEVLNRCTMAMRNIANNAHIVVGPPAEELARLRAQLQLLADMPALISG